MNFNLDGTVDVANGVAWSLVSGGSTGSLQDRYRWYVGENRALLLRYYQSLDIPIWHQAALLGIRDALTDANTSAPAEIEGLTENGFLLMARAETMDTNTVRRMVGDMPPRGYGWNVAYTTAWDQAYAGRVAAGDTPQVARVFADDNANVPHCAPGAPFDRVPKALLDEWVGEDVKAVYNGSARCTYTVMAGVGGNLIESGHHSVGMVDKAVKATIRLYTLDTVIKRLGGKVDVFANCLTHDALHPLNIGRLCAWAQSPPVVAQVKIAPTILTRRPFFPGSTTFIKNAYKVVRALEPMREFGPIRAVLDAQRQVARGEVVPDVVVEAEDEENPFLAAVEGEDQPEAEEVVPEPAPAPPVVNTDVGVVKLERIHAAIVANPLQYSPAFGGEGYDALKADVDSLRTFAAFIFGVYDASINRGVGATIEGPTGGEGMTKLIQEHFGPYRNGRVAYGVSTRAAGEDRRTVADLVAAHS